MALNLSSSLTANAIATQPPVMAAVRVPPSACITSQSIVIVRSPSFSMSTAVRSERPISRWISNVRPDGLPWAACRGVLVDVDLGSMAYSAVTQPRPRPRKKGGTLFSTVAVQMTLVLPASISAEPSAVDKMSGWIRVCRGCCGVLPSIRMNFHSRPTHVAATLYTVGRLSRSNAGRSWKRRERAINMRRNTAAPGIVR